MGGDVSLFPNPSTESITLSINANVQVKSVNVFDATGRLITNVKVQSSNNLQIDISYLAKGIYFIEMNTNAGLVRKSFVKN